ncbi:MAG: DUF429 domain-containing protein, partial [Chloroflexi bacterium]|nr:DUF429 domain-containing protein [Chloroflexota bacterium]
LLAGVYGDDLARLATSEVGTMRGVGFDDLYDALALLWTAGRILRGEAERVPHDPPSDSRGLLMEIVY